MKKEHSAVYNVHVCVRHFIDVVFCGFFKQVYTSLLREC